MRTKATEATEIVLSLNELRDQIKANFKKGDILHVVKGGRKIYKKDIVFLEAYDSFFMAECDVSQFYKETVTIAFAELLVGNVVIPEIRTKKPIVKQEK